MVEDETFSLEMFAATLLEVFENPAIELPNLLEALIFQDRPRLLTANTAGTKRDNRLLLQLFGQRFDGLGEVGEVAELEIDRVLEGANLDFKPIPSIEQRDRLPFVKPTFQLPCRESRRRSRARINARHPQRDDLLLEPNAIVPKRLIVADAFLHSQVREASIAAKLFEKCINATPRAGQEQVDPFGAEQDRPFELLCVALVYKGIA